MWFVTFYATRLMFARFVNMAVSLTICALWRGSVIIMQFSNLFNLKMSCDKGLFSSCNAISGVGVLFLLFSLKTGLTGKLSLLSSSMISNSVIDVGKVLIIAEMSFSFFNLYV